MVQMIDFSFENEEAARKGGSFIQGMRSFEKNNEVSIMFGIGYTTKETQGGTITVTGSGGKNVIEFKDVKLTALDKSVVVSGKIPF